MSHSTILGYQVILYTDLFSVLGHCQFLSLLRFLFYSEYCTVLYKQIVTNAKCIELICLTTPKYRKLHDLLLHGLKLV